MPESFIDKMVKIENSRDFWKERAQKLESELYVCQQNIAILETRLKGLRYISKFKQQKIERLQSEKQALQCQTKS